MAKYRKWLGYVVFAVIACGLFMYLCFPSEAVREYMEASTSKVAPAFSLKIRRVRLTLPFGLELEQTYLDHLYQPGITLFKADSFVLIPSMQTFVLRKPVLRFDCRAYKGSIKGIVASETFSLAGPYQSDIEVDGVLLGQYPLLRQKLKRQCTGAMTGTLSYMWAQGDFLQGSGRADLSIADGTVRFAQPFLGLESVDFHRISAQVILKNQTISLHRLDFQGKQVEGTGSGTIRLNPSFERSSLDLTVSVKPVPNFFEDKGGLLDAAQFLVKRSKDNHFTMNVRGTIAQPRINFI